MAAATSTSERVVDSAKVWTTLITNTNYLSGLLTLDYSLKAAGSKYPLVALYTDTFPPEGHAALKARGIQDREMKDALLLVFANKQDVNGCKRDAKQGT